MSLKYEPASEPLHFYVKKLFSRSEEVTRRPHLPRNPKKRRRRRGGGGAEPEEV